MPPFKYEAFVNPYIGSISELMGKGDEAKAQALLRIGEIQARAEEQRGQAWGNAVQSIGNMASKAITDYNSPEAQDRRESEKAKVAFNEMMRTPDTEVQGVRRVSDPGVQAQPADWLGKGTDEVRGVLPSKSFVPTITQTNKYKNMAAPGIGGLDTWNVDAIMQELAQKGVSPEQAFKYSQILDSANTRMEKHHASAVNLMQQDVYGILQYPADMRLGAAEAAIKKYGNNGVFSAETLQGATRSLAAIKALPANQQAVAVSKFLLGMSGQQDVILNQNPGDVGRSTLTGESFGGPPAAREGFTLADGATRYDSDGKLIVSNAEQPPGRKLTGATFEMRDSKTGKSGMYQRFEDGSVERIGDVIPPVVAGKEMSRVDVFDPQSETVTNVVAGSQQHADLLKNGGVPVGSLTGVTASIAANIVSENSRKAAYDYSNALIREIDNLLVKGFKPEQKPGQAGQAAVDVPDTYLLTEGAKANYGVQNWLTPPTPGSAKANARVQLNKIRSGTLLATLTKLKESSANGSTGFGALNIAELIELQNASNTLQAAQDGESALRELVRMRNSAVRIKQGYESDPPKQRTGSGRPTGSPPPGKFRIEEELPNLGDTVQLPRR